MQNGAGLDHGGGAFRVEVGIVERPYDTVHQGSGYKALFQLNAVGTLGYASMQLEPDVLSNRWHAGAALNLRAGIDWLSGPGVALAAAVDLGFRHVWNGCDLNSKPTIMCGVSGAQVDVPEFLSGTAFAGSVGGTIIVMRHVLGLDVRFGREYNLTLKIPQPTMNPPSDTTYGYQDIRPVFFEVGGWVDVGALKRWISIK